MNPASIGNIVYNDVALAPCTAAAAVELIRETGLALNGLEVVMVGHSEIVGKPIALMLMAEGATVTVCHHMTRSVAMHSRRADVLVVAVGRAHLVGADMIRPGAAVIDIGINQIEDADGSRASSATWTPRPRSTWPPGSRPCPAASARSRSRS